MVAKRRNKSRRNKRPSRDEQEIKDEINKKTKETPVLLPLDKNTLVISTGCTLLDLAISGGRIHGGGIPGGILVEIFGPPSSGKTALAVDIGSSVQFNGGEVDIADPESRLDQEYTLTYGLDLPKENYSKPDTVTEVFDDIKSWEPKNENVINAKIVDSVAALSTDMEMYGEKGDKRGQKKAKELHAGCRTSARLISHGNKLIVFTNQELDGEYGPTTSGGKAVPFYASLRIRIKQMKKVEPKRTLKSGKIVKKTIGILSECTVFKSSIDDGYRTAPLYIIYGAGIDDVRGNLQWYKDMMKGTKYIAVDQEYQQLNAAIKYIEKNNLEADLREMVIELWNEIEEGFKIKRKKIKQRF